MTDFKLEATFNTICRPGRVVRILTKNGKEENVPIRVWKRQSSRYMSTMY